MTLYPERLTSMYIPKITISKNLKFLSTCIDKGRGLPRSGFLSQVCAMIRKDYHDSLSNCKSECVALM